jgi:hypothetical protein
LTNIETYYHLSTEVKAGLNSKLHEMNPAQQLKAKQVIEAFEAAEKTFYEFRHKISELNDACAWINTLNQKSDSSYADYWRNKFNKLKVFANGGPITSEVIEMLK